MKKLLLSCDQVFEVLTRGPFPTGDESDEHVEHHLRACHDCRQLAEALRPAVELMHEVVSEDQALDLPQYEGSLPDAVPAPPRLSVVRLAKPRMKQPTRGSTTPQVRRAALGSALMRGSRHAAIALSLIIIGSSLWLTGMVSERGANGKRPLFATVQRWFASTASENVESRDGLPTGAGLVSLASLNLPAACLPLTHRPLSQEHAAEIAVSLRDGSLEKLRCCTECHHAGQPRTDDPDGASQANKGVLAFTSVASESCQICHHG